MTLIKVETEDKLSNSLNSRVVSKKITVQMSVERETPQKLKNGYLNEKVTSKMVSTQEETNNLNFSLVTAMSN